MGKIIAVAADKGGTGKTSTVLALSQAFTKKGMKVLAVDLDPQANLTKAFTGKRGNDMEDTLPSALRERKPLPVINCNNVCLVPSDISLSFIEDDLQQPLSVALKNFLASAIKQSDIVFLDCPPGASNRIAYNALSIADYVLIPATADDFSIDAIDSMQELISTIPTVSIAGILITMHKNNGGNIYKAFESLMRERYGELVLDTCIRSTAKMKEKIAFNTPLFIQRSLVKGAPKHIDDRYACIAEYDYLSAADELLKKLK